MQSSGEQRGEEGAAGSLPGVYIKTFGCQMNEYDSEKIFASLCGRYRRAAAPEDADVIIINTCSVRDKAEQKLYSYLGALAPLKKANGRLKIGIAGCVAEQEGQKIIARSGLVDFVVGTHNISKVFELLLKTGAGLGPQVAVGFKAGWEHLTDGEAAEPEEPRSPRALVAVQRGCSKRCSFCVVPSTRGPQLSRSPAEVLAEVRAKAAWGCKEVLLLGQTVNSYGLDLRPRVLFEDLLEQVSGIPGIERIRFTSPHPSDMRPSLIAVFGQVGKVCPHVHLPLQSGSSRVLRAMRRSYTMERYLEIVDEFRAVCPDIAFSSDIIVGFPGETDEDFEQTLEAMRRVRFHSCFSFCYSPRPNTKALELKELEIPHEIAQNRLSRLQQMQDLISEEINRALLGRTLDILVEGAGKKLSSLPRGRTPHNVLVEVQGPVRPGDIVRVVIEHAGPHGLRGSVAPETQTSS